MKIGSNEVQLSREVYKAKVRQQVDSLTVEDLTGEQITQKVQFENNIVKAGQAKLDVTHFENSCQRRKDIYTEVKTTAEKLNGIIRTIKENDLIGKNTRATACVGVAWDANYVGALNAEQPGAGEDFANYLTASGTAAPNNGTWIATKDAWIAYTAATLDAERANYNNTVTEANIKIGSLNSFQGKTLIVDGAEINNNRTKFTVNGDDLIIKQLGDFNRANIVRVFDTAAKFKDFDAAQIDDQSKQLSILATMANDEIYEVENNGLKKPQLEVAKAIVSKNYDDAKAGIENLFDFDEEANAGIITTDQERRDKYIDRILFELYKSKDLNSRIFAR